MTNHMHVSGAVSSVLAAMLVASVPPAPPKHAGSLWHGQSAGYSVDWTQADLKLSRGAQSVFSAQREAGRAFALFRRTEVETRNTIGQFEQDVWLLSVVGPIVSYQVDEDTYCRSADDTWAWPHPDDNTDYYVLDMSRPGHTVRLTDFFSAAQIRQALLGDPLVKKALHSQRNGVAPTSLEAFTELELEPRDIGVPGSGTPCTFGLASNYLEHFAFHHVERDYIAVRIILQPTVGWCRALHSQLGLLLPIPARLRGALTLAAAQKAGVLMNDALRMSHGRCTEIRYTVSPPKSPKSRRLRGRHTGVSVVKSVRTRAE